jgi:hypothetical protein
VQSAKKKKGWNILRYTSWGEHGTLQRPRTGATSTYGYMCDECDQSQGSWPSVLRSVGATHAVPGLQVKFVICNFLPIVCVHSPCHNDKADWWRQSLTSLFKAMFDVTFSSRAASFASAVLFPGRPQWQDIQQSEMSLVPWGGRILDAESAKLTVTSASALELSAKQRNSE